MTLYRHIDGVKLVLSSNTCPFGILLSFIGVDWVGDTIAMHMLRAQFYVSSSACR